MYNGVEVNGGKNLTSRTGTITPMIFYWPLINDQNTRRIRETLVDFTDMLPSLADLARVKIPASYGQLDGISFIDDIVLNPKKITDRDWVFAQWDNSPFDDKVPIRYVNDEFYKLYDSLQNNEFYHIAIDSKELNPLEDSELTANELTIKSNFRRVLDSLKKN